MPAAARLTAIERRGEAFLPEADTVIQSGDAVTVIGESEGFDRVRRVFHTQADAGRRVIIHGGSTQSVWVCRSLRHRQFTVRLFEPDRARAEELAGKLDWVTVLNSDAIHTDALREERVDQADAFIAVTDDDETNILSAARAKSMGAKSAIAVLQRPTYLQTGGSTRGVTDAIEGRAALGMASRALDPEEAVELEATTIARDGIGCIVHADNPLGDLSREQVIGVFRGEIRNWSQLGGAELPIVVVTKAEGRSTLELFCQHFDLEPQEIAAQVVIGDNAQGIKSVAANPGAIGYVSIGAAETDADAGTPIRLLALDGVTPSVATLRAGDWVLARPLNLLRRRDTAPSVHVQGLIALARSADVDDLIGDLAFVPPQR